MTVPSDIRQRDVAEKLWYMVFKQHDLVAGKSSAEFKTLTERHFGDSFTEEEFDTALTMCNEWALFAARKAAGVPTEEETI